MKTIAEWVTIWNEHDVLDCTACDCEVCVALIEGITEYLKYKAETQ